MEQFSRLQNLGSTNSCRITRRRNILDADETHEKNNNPLETGLFFQRGTLGGCQHRNTAQKITKIPHTAKNKVTKKVKRIYILSQMQRTVYCRRSTLTCEYIHIKTNDFPQFGNDWLVTQLSIENTAHRRTYQHRKTAILDLFPRNTASWKIKSRTP